MRKRLSFPLVIPTPYRRRSGRQANLPLTTDNSTIGTTSDNRGALRVAIPSGAKVAVHNGLIVLAEELENTASSTFAPLNSLLSSNDSTSLAVLSDSPPQSLGNLLNFASVTDNLYKKLIPNLLLNLFKKDSNSESGNNPGGSGTTVNPNKNPSGGGNLCPAVDCNFDKSSLCNYQSAAGGGGETRSWQLSSTQVANSLTGIFKDISGSA